MPTKEFARHRIQVSSKAGPERRVATRSQGRRTSSPSMGSSRQQTAGNAAVQRADVATPTDNPIVGLKRQDGLDFGTTRKQPEVKLLQSKLNDKVGSALSVDGMWGKKTSGSLEYSRLHVAQSKAVTQVERDLRDGVEKKSDPLLIQALKFAAEKILDGLLGGGATSFRTAIKAGITLIEDADIDGKLKDFGVDKPFDAAKKAASERIAQELTSLGDTDPLSAFVDTQHNALAEATLKNQEAFIAVSKPELRKKQAKGAQALLDELKKQTADAPERQYDATVKRWAQVNAQRTLGVTASTTDPADPAGTTFVEGLEGKSVASVPGVLEIDINFDPDAPKTPVKVNEITIAGLSPKVREHINKQNPTLGQLGFPSRASGDSISSIIGLGSRLSVARAEDKGFVTEISQQDGPISGTSDGGRKYFTDKGDGNGVVGIARLFSEIDPLNVVSLGGLKGP